MKVVHAAVRGFTHQVEQRACYDVVASVVWENHGAVAMASGAGHCKFGREGAETVVYAMLEHLEHRGEVWLGEGCSRAEILTEVVSVCRAALSETGYTMEEQACTLIFSVTRMDGAFLCGNLGDGFIFSTSVGEVRLLSIGEMGLQRSSTLRITDSRAEAYLRLIDGWLEEGESIVLCSSGMEEALQDQYRATCEESLRRMAVWMCEFNQQEMSRILEIALMRNFQENTCEDLAIALITPGEK